MRKAIIIILPLILLFTSVSASAQDKPEPGIQWDTATKVLPVQYPEHLIGIRYDFAFTGVSMTPDMSIKRVNSAVNLAVLYTFYHPLWLAYDYFGLQTGVRYSKYGFLNDRYAFEHFEQTVTTVEIPFLSAFHADIGERFRILLSLGPFVGYRLSTTKDNGFDCFDIRWDYGIVGGAGIAYIPVRWMEIHLEGAFHYSLSMLYYPQKMSTSYWVYSYPWQASICLGLHFKIKSGKQKI